jgi:2-keto-4-pentenoate hydratase/2-oxohepta-3-ene-1,7-dioic acid hydratase in catechol pathway
MKIICIGRNYADHVKELNNDMPDEPVIFLKPDSAIIPKGQPFFYPDFSTDVHFEVELVIKICKLGKRIDEKYASTYYTEIGLGIDFTARDIQRQCKEKGLPWEKAKAFDHSAPLSPEFIPVSEIEDLGNLDFRLEKNGEIVQEGNTSQMLFPINRLIVETSKYFTLKIGDLIFTGTPKGVGPVQIGDKLVGYIGDKKMFDLKVK